MVPESEPTELKEVERHDDPLLTLTSGQRKEVRGGSLQAHACAITHLNDVTRVMEAFQTAPAFQGVASWSYAYRLVQEIRDQGGETAGDARGVLLEGLEDGLDEGCGEKILSVLRRASLQGLLLIVSRWQDHCRSPGLEIFGLEVYALVVERCKELITNIKLATSVQVPMHGTAPEERHSQNFDFSFLPKLPEPRVATKFGPNHFLYDTPMNKPRSLRSLFGGGDVNLWMANDESLRHLEESELWTLRSLRQPDARIEKVLHAVALLRGQSPKILSGDPVARWGSLLQVLRSPTLRTELLLFDARSVPLDTAKIVLASLQSMQANDVRRANPGAAALFEWALGVARLRCSGSAEEEAIDFAALRPREADLSPLPKLGASRMRIKGVNGSRRCKLPGFDRSRSAALLGMTLF